MIIELQSMIGWLEFGSNTFVRSSLAGLSSWLLLLREARTLTLSSSNSVGELPPCPGGCGHQGQSWSAVLEIIEF